MMDYMNICHVNTTTPHHTTPHHQKERAKKKVENEIENTKRKADERMKERNESNRIVHISPSTRSNASMERRFGN